MRVVVGVTGGIAAYKAVGVVRALVLAGHDVHVVPTAGALRFVGRPTFEAISRNPVETDLYEGVAEVRHVALGQSADLIIVAPATANSIAKLAAGLADDLLGTTILASTAPVVIAPAMHTEMWQNPSTVANIATLAARGITVVGPEVGQLTGTDAGAGRMSEPDAIVAAALAAASTANTADLAGRRVLVSAGGTREPIDPVRFLGNRSSGLQGVAIAAAAAARGADVTLVAAHLEVPEPQGVRVLHAATALDLQRVMTAEAPAHDVIVMAAAVADYRPASVDESKIKKDATGHTLTLELVQNPDVLAGLSLDRPAGQVVVGFAAETERDDSALLELGRAKIARKGCDYLVVNRVGWSEGFTVADNDVRVLDAAGAIVVEAVGTKTAVAHRILDLLV
nr:bifunctional phosphopantothenoylcysteine decarboxylase/phosphopantothenate--cysteine ligase CoaBC [Marisediminicola senii]